MQDPEPKGIGLRERAVSIAELDMEQRRKVLNIQFQGYYELDRTL